MLEPSLPKDHRHASRLRKTNPVAIKRNGGEENRRRGQPRPLAMPQIPGRSKRGKSTSGIADTPTLSNYVCHYPIPCPPANGKRRTARRLYSSTALQPYSSTAGDNPTAAAADQAP